MQRVFYFLSLFFVLQLNAQVENSYRDILKKYNTSLDVISNNLLQKDSSLAFSIIRNNEEFYLRLIDLDTVTAKAFMLENTFFLDSFNKELLNPLISDSIKHKHITSYYEAGIWYNQQQLHVALDQCPTCFLVRKVRVIVMKRVNDQKLDTVKCLSVDFQKILPNNITGIQRNLTSFPCPEYEQILSTGPNYLFTVHYKETLIPFTKSINIGSAQTDVQQISIVIPEDKSEK